MTFGILYAIAFGNGKFVAVGSFGTILTSTDGATWNPQTSGTDKPLIGIAYGNGKFVSVGYEGIMLTSTDGTGTQWNPQNSGTTKGFNAVAYGSGKFVAVGGNGIILTASELNLSSWASQTSTVTDSRLNGIIMGNNTFVAVGDTGTIIQSDPLPEPNISVSPAFYDFGTVPLGSSVTSTSIIISNTGTANLIINTVDLVGTSEFIKSNDGCSGQTIAPSASCSVQVTLTPTSGGNKNANLNIPSNDPDTPTFNVSLLALV